MTSATVGPMRLKRLKIAGAALAVACLAGTGLGLTSASASAPYSCTTTTLPHGKCGPYASYAPIAIDGQNVSQPFVDQNAWAPGPGYAATLAANSPGDWQVTGTVTPNNGAIQSFPNAGWGMPYPEVRADSYTTLPSSWDVTIPDHPGIAAWAAYDLWFNNWGAEVMIQTDIQAGPAYNCSGPSATIDGRPWHFCDFGSERVIKPGLTDPPGGWTQATAGNMPSGSVDVQKILQWLVSTGHLPASSTWTAGSFGFELASTGGTPEPFTVNQFAFATHATGPGPTPTPTTPAPTPTATSPAPTPTPTTTTPAALPAPSALSQAPHVIVNFSWGAVTGAANYTVQVQNAAFQDIAFRTGITGTRLNNVEVPAQSQLRWRVRAGSTGTWSAWRTFTSP